MSDTATFESPRLTILEFAPTESQRRARCARHVLRLTILEFAPTESLQVRFKVGENLNRLTILEFAPTESRNGAAHR